MHTLLTDRTLRRWMALGWCALLMALSGCGADASELDGWAGAPRPAAYDAAIIGQAEQDLKLHDVRRARARYTEALATQDPRVEGTAAAGKAVTELMLLPGSAAVRELVVEQLGAQNRSYDVQRLIWSDSGALYWFEQGVRWEDDGEFEGVRSIVSGDLPWSLERLDAADVFVAGLDQPGDRIAEALVAIADELRGLEQDLQTAIFDPKFEYLYLPSEVFHHDAMSMALGKSELAAIHGVVSLARSGAYLVAAYRHPWTLEEAFTPAAPGVAPIDHAAPYLDPLLGRQLVGEDPQDTLRRARLNEARLAARNGLSFLHTSISLGLESEVLEISPLRWDRVDRDLGYDLVDILQALENAVDGPAKIPHATDDLSVDLSVFFEGACSTLRSRGSSAPRPRPRGRTRPWWARCGRSWGAGS